MNQQEQQKLFEDLQRNRYSFCDKVKVFFNHLKIMLFSNREERLLYAQTFENYKRWKNQQ